MEIQQFETSELTDKQQQLTIFYDSLDEDTANYLKAKEYEIDKLSNKYLSQLGKIFKEAQDRLSKNGYGTFGKWIEAKGIKIDTVYNWIHRYELIAENFGNQTAIETIENMPKSLSYEISKPSAPAKLVQDVMDGKITKHKDYMIEKAKIEAEAKAKYEEQLAEKDKLLQQEKHFQQMLNQRINNINHNLIEEQKVKDKYLTELQEKDKQIKKLKAEVKTEIIYEESPELQKALWEAQQKANELNEKLVEAEDELGKLQYIKEKGIEKYELEAKINKLKSDLTETTKDTKNIQLILNFIDKTNEFIKQELLHIPTLIMPLNLTDDYKDRLRHICSVIDNFQFAIKEHFKL